MMYYNANSGQFVSAALLGFGSKDMPDLASLGLLPVLGDSIPPHNIYVSYTVFSGMVLMDDAYYKSFIIKDFDIDKLRQNLSTIYALAVSAFSPIFSALDLKRSRPIASITEAQALGQTPDPADVDRLGQLNMIVEENRAILAELKSTAIPTGATLEQAQAIVIAAAEVKPWLPTGYEELAHV